MKTLDALLAGAEDGQGAVRGEVLAAFRFVRDEEPAQPLSRDGLVTYIPLYSPTASIIATMFSMGVSACTLWMALKMKPPPGAKISFEDLLANLLRRAEGEGLLGVDPTAPEGEAVAGSSDKLVGRGKIPNQDSLAMGTVPRQGGRLLTRIPFP